MGTGFLSGVPKLFWAWTEVRVAQPGRCPRCHCAPHSPRGELSGGEAISIKITALTRDNPQVPRPAHSGVSAGNPLPGQGTQTELLQPPRKKGWS